MSIWSILFEKSSEEKKQSDFSVTTPNKSSTEIPVRTDQENIFQKTLTSQLVACWYDTREAKYKDEFYRRLKLCGVSDDVAKKTFEFEKEIISRCQRPELKNPKFISRPIFNMRYCILEHPIEYYETHFDYPLSYVIKISDEAEWHYHYSHERNLSEEVWAEIFALSDINQKLFLPYAHNLVNNLGWTVSEVNKFSYHEQGMLDLYRWNKKSTKAVKNPWNMK